MYQFHATVHARSAVAAPGPVIDISGETAQTLAVPHEALAEPMALSFEEAAERLGELERLFIEPDGSFVWVSSQAGPRWQIDGNLFDRSCRLLFVDLKGSCPAEEFDRLLTALGWPATTMMFQLVREAVLLDEAEFRRWASKVPGTAY